MGSCPGALGRLSGLHFSRCSRQQTPKSSAMTRKTLRRGWSAQPHVAKRAGERVVRRVGATSREGLRLRRASEGDEVEEVDHIAEVEAAAALTSAASPQEGDALPPNRDTSTLTPSEIPPAQSACALPRTNADQEHGGKDWQSRESGVGSGPQSGSPSLR